MCDMCEIYICDRCITFKKDDYEVYIGQHVYMACVYVGYSKVVYV